MSNIKKHAPLHARLLMACLLATGFVAQGAVAQTIVSTITNHWPDSRYTVHAAVTDGTSTGTITVTDAATGLMWQQCSQGQAGAGCTTGSATTHTWQQALQLATTANTNKIAGYEDWRLPNIKELASLAALDRYNPAINLTAFPNTPSAYFWSSSPDAGDGSYAWLVFFDYGYGSDYYRGSYAHVRLVRGGQ
jgi:hypothetical protein